MKVLHNGKAVETTNPPAVGFASEEAKLKSYAGELRFLGRHTIADMLEALAADRDAERASAISFHEEADRLRDSLARANADRDCLRTFVRSARGIVQAYASEHPKLVCQGSYQGDPMGAHAWLAAEAAEVGTNRDGGDPKVERA